MFPVRRFVPTFNCRRDNVAEGAFPACADSIRMLKNPRPAVVPTAKTAHEPDDAIPAGGKSQVINLGSDR